MGKTTDQADVLSLVKKYIFKFLDGCANEGTEKLISAIKVVMNDVAKAVSEYYEEYKKQLKEQGTDKAPKHKRNSVLKQKTPDNTVENIRKQIDMRNQFIDMGMDYGSSAVYWAMKQAGFSDDQVDEVKSIYEAQISVTEKEDDEKSDALE